MSFFEQIGKMALGSRVRFLSEKIGEDAAKIYKTYDVGLYPKWFPVFYVISKGEKKTVTSIAQAIGHSHASVSKIISEMAAAGVVLEKTDPEDRRSTIVGLSKTGKEIARKIELQYIDVNAAVEELCSQADHDLWKALGEWEYLLEQKSLLLRVLDKKKNRESQAVRIEAYQNKHRDIFRRLNEEWITTHFKMEKPDRDALENPRKYILDRGGYVFVALLEEKPVGVCAMLKMDDGRAYELAKMAVSPEAQGKNIGFMLGKAVIGKARTLKADRVYLESNTKLKPAIALYQKLGFKKVTGRPSPYERANIQMEINISKRRTEDNG